MRNALLALVLTLGLTSALVASGQTPTASASTDPHTLIVQMMERNPALATYETRVHVNIRMLNFPFYSPKLDGTSYYKRPDRSEVVFDHVPFYAKGFSRLFNDIGDPSGWEKLQNVTFDGTQTVDGSPMLVLRLTKKIHSDILDHTLAFIDPTTLELRRMEWHYTSGGLVVMTQAYRQEGQYTLVTSQHATINIPHVHAIADSTFAPYQTNVELNDSVFAQQ